MKKDYVTQEDITTIEFFIKERSDIKRWTDWDERKLIIQKEFPELISAINSLDVAEKTLARILESIVDSCYKYPEE